MNCTRITSAAPDFQFVQQDRLSVVKVQLNAKDFSIAVAIVLVYECFHEAIGVLVAIGEHTNDSVVGIFIRLIDGVNILTKILEIKAVFFAERENIIKVSVKVALLRVHEVMVHF